MTSPKNILLALLTVTTVGGALLAWRQYAELVELRAVAMHRDERSEFQKRIWDLEKANRDLQDQIMAARGVIPADAEIASTENDGERNQENRRRGDVRDSGRGRGGPPPQITAMRDLMNKPEVQAMLAQQQKAALDSRYAALFKNLNLSPEQADKLKSLLIERQASRQDVFEAARAQGIDPRENPEAFRKLMADTRNEVEGSIKSLLGDTGYAQLQNYEQTMPQRGLVNDIQQRLSYTNTPLTASQAEQLVQILAANAPQRPAAPASSGEPTLATVNIRDGNMSFEFRGPGPGGPGGPPRGGPDMGFVGAMIGGPGGMGAMFDSGRGATVTDAAVNQAQGVLSQPQVAVLKQVQQQQQTQQQLAQMVRETMTAGSTSAARGSSTGSATGTPSASGGSQSPRRRPGGGG